MTYIDLNTPNQGWQCPLCKMVHAPWVSYCSCQTYTTNEPIIWYNNDNVYVDDAIDGNK